MALIGSEGQPKIEIERERERERERRRWAAIRVVVPYVLQLLGRVGETVRDGEREWETRTQTQGGSSDHPVLE